jgi:hypothetical protein
MKRVHGGIKKMFAVIPKQVCARREQTSRSTVYFQLAPFSILQYLVLAEIAK